MRLQLCMLQSRLRWGHCAPCVLPLPLVVLLQRLPLVQLLGCRRTPLHAPPRSVATAVVLCVLLMLQPLLLLQLPRRSLLVLLPLVLLILLQSLLRGVHVNLAWGLLGWHAGARCQGPRAARPAERPDRGTAAVSVAALAVPASCWRHCAPLWDGHGQPRALGTHRMSAAAAVPELRRCPLPLGRRLCRRCRCRAGVRQAPWLSDPIHHSVGTFIHANNGAVEPWLFEISHPHGRLRALCNAGEIRGRRRRGGSGRGPRSAAPLPLCALRKNGQVAAAPLPAAPPPQRSSCMVTGVEKVARQWWIGPLVRSPT
jgi:hypothetical protein